MSCWLIFRADRSALILNLTALDKLMDRDDVNRMLKSYVVKICKRMVSLSLRGGGLRSPRRSTQARRSRSRFVKSPLIHLSLLLTVIVLQVVYSNDVRGASLYVYMCARYWDQLDFLRRAAGFLVAKAYYEVRFRCL